MALLVPEKPDGLGGFIVVRKLAHLALRGFCRQLFRDILADAQQGRHGALPYRHGHLHGPAAGFKEARSICNRQRASRG